MAIWPTHRRRAREQVRKKRWEAAARRRERDTVRRAKLRAAA
jgi:hypothetical protein